MKSRLDTITNWAELAADANYRVEPLAELCHISISQLERYFRFKLSTTPHRWMIELRLGPFAQPQGTRSIKESAAEAGYTRPCNYSRDFKKVFGLSPRNYYSGL
jgi:AraC family transcriptional regulator, exoenzyme S synthesis regulatory protein ExsA